MLISKGWILCVLPLRLAAMTRTVTLDCAGKFVEMNSPQKSKSLQPDETMDTNLI
jgi:hypothetical protein